MYPIIPIEPIIVVSIVVSIIPISSRAGSCETNRITGRQASGQKQSVREEHPWPNNGTNPLERVLTLRIHVPNIWVLGIWVIVIIVQDLSKSMIIRYLDP